MGEKFSSTSRSWVTISPILAASVKIQKKRKRKLTNSIHPKEPLSSLFAYRLAQSVVLDLSAIGSH